MFGNLSGAVEGKAFGKVRHEGFDNKEKLGFDLSSKKLSVFDKQVNNDKPKILNTKLDLKLPKSEIPKLNVSNKSLKFNNKLKGGMPKLNMPKFENKLNAPLPKLSMPKVMDRKLNSPKLKGYGIKQKSNKNDYVGLPNKKTCFDPGKFVGNTKNVKLNKNKGFDPGKYIGNVENVGWNRLNQQKGLTLFGDKDKDGKVNLLDCNPINKKLQGVEDEKVGRMLAPIGNRDLSPLGDRGVGEPLDLTQGDVEIIEPDTTNYYRGADDVIPGKAKVVTDVQDDSLMGVIGGAEEELKEQKETGREVKESELIETTEEIETSEETMFDEETGTSKVSPTEKIRRVMESSPDDMTPLQKRDEEAKERQRDLRERGLDLRKDTLSFREMQLRQKYSTASRKGKGKSEKLPYVTKSGKELRKLAGQKDRDPRLLTGVGRGKGLINPESLQTGGRGFLNIEAIGAARSSVPVGYKTGLAGAGRGFYATAGQLVKQPDAPVQLPPIPMDYVQQPIPQYPEQYPQSQPQIQESPQSYRTKITSPFSGRQVSYTRGPYRKRQ